MLRSITSFFTAMPDGSERFIKLGDLVAPDDPVVTGNEASFADITPDTSSTPRSSRRQTRRTS